MADRVHSELSRSSAGDRIVGTVNWWLTPDEHGLCVQFAQVLVAEGFDAYDVDREIRTTLRTELPEVLVATRSSGDRACGLGLHVKYSADRPVIRIQAALLALAQQVDGVAYSELLDENPFLAPKP